MVIFSRGNWPLGVPHSGALYMWDTAQKPWDPQKDKTAQKWEMNWNRRWLRSVGQKDFVVVVVYLFCWCWGVSWGWVWESLSSSRCLMGPSMWRGSINVTFPALSFPRRGKLLLIRSREELDTYSSATSLPFAFQSCCAQQLAHLLEVLQWQVYLCGDTYDGPVLLWPAGIFI